jgi:hypothetical protein
VPVHDSRYAGWLVDSVRSGLVAIDARGDVAALNAAGHRVLGCAGGDPAALIGRVPGRLSPRSRWWRSDCSKRSTAPSAGVAPS